MTVMGVRVLIHINKIRLLPSGDLAVTVKKQSQVLSLLDRDSLIHSSTTITVKTYLYVPASEITEIQKAPISKVEARNTIKHQCLKLWDEEYQSIEKGSHYKMFQPSVLINLPSTSDQFMDSMLLRQRFGHCRLNYHLHRIGINDSSGCDCCGTPEKVTHFSVICSQFRHQRSFAINKVQEFSMPFTARSLLTERILLPYVKTYIAQCRNQL